MSGTKSKYVVDLVSSDTVDVWGFQSRLKGLKVRDCLLILEPGHKVRLGLLTRPAMETTVVESGVRGHGGVLDIDGCRISTSKKDADIAARRTGGEMYSESSNKIYGKGYQRLPANISDGRFPSNLILKHGKECYCDGTKKVKGSSSEGIAPKLGINYKTKKRFAYGKDAGGLHRKETTYYDEDGMEEVPNWICEPTCPVRILDAQSGNRPSNNCLPSTGFAEGSIFSKGISTHRSAGYGDEGGASRFFKQVTHEDELDTYLKTLIRENTNE